MNILQTEDNVIGSPKDSGAMAICPVEVNRPLPCIVILIHGVNDIAEAYPNLDKGICAGLNKRLGRDDLVPNNWEIVNDISTHFAPRMVMQTEWYKELEHPRAELKDKVKPKRVKYQGNSPVIPFYWGYRPIDKQTYDAEQKAYEAALLKKDPNVDIPYDSYWIERAIEIENTYLKLSRANCDKYKNWIDNLFHRNGGPYSDATTCIPDMYGPGLTGFTNDLARLGTFAFNSGAEAYKNPHRIYLVYAAQRLAELIIKIRTDDKMKEAPINIVAHSQGTIISMLANMLIEKMKVDQEDGKFATVYPADCVILTHSPYAFDPSFLETQSKALSMGVQTQQAREETFINFVQTIKDGQKLRIEKWSDPQQLLAEGVAYSAAKRLTDKQPEKVIDFTDPKNSRNNFGKVYNYFSPNDHVVSLWSVQGMGWQGIPDTIMDRSGDSLKQRIFYHAFSVGDDPNQLTCYTPSGKVEINRPDYLNKHNLSQRANQYDDSDYLYGIAQTDLNQQELAMLNSQQIIRNGQVMGGYYRLDSDKIILFYRANKVILDRLNNDIESNEYNSLTTGGASTAWYPNEQRRINGEEVPEPVTYYADKLGSRSNLNRAIFYGDLYNRYQSAFDTYKQGISIKEALIYSEADAPTEGLVNNQYRHKGMGLVTDQQWIAKIQALHPEWGEIESIEFASALGGVDLDDWVKNGQAQSYIVTRQLLATEKNSEFAEHIAQSSDSSTHHSGITTNEETTQHILAYDLAIGKVKGYSKTNRYFWQELIAEADWRSPKNTNDNAIRYRDSGILPENIKKAMNRPERYLPDRVNNDFYHTFSLSDTFTLGSTLRSTILKILSKGQQWPLPEPDTKGGR